MHPEVRESLDGNKNQTSEPYGKVSSLFHFILFLSFVFEKLNLFQKKKKRVQLEYMLIAYKEIKEQLP